jgi:hypothetical protein
VHVYTGNDPSAPSLANEMSNDLLTFGRTGKPNWVPYSLDSRNIKLFNVPSSMLQASDQSPHNLVYDFWMNS